MISIDTITIIISNLGLWFILYCRFFTSNLRPYTIAFIILTCTSLYSSFVRSLGAPRYFKSGLSFYISSIVVSYMSAYYVKLLTSNTVVIYLLVALIFISVFLLWFPILKICCGVDSGYRLSPENISE